METRKKVKNVDKKILQSGRVLINNARARSRKGFARGGAVPFRLVANIRASHFEAAEVVHRTWNAHLAPAQPMCICPTRTLLQDSSCTFFLLPQRQSNKACSYASDAARTRTTKSQSVLAGFCQEQLWTSYVEAKIPGHQVARGKSALLRQATRCCASFLTHPMSGL